MQALDYVSGLHNCLEFSQSSPCLDKAMKTHVLNFYWQLKQFDATTVPSIALLGL